MSGWSSSTDEPAGPGSGDFSRFGPDADLASGDPYPDPTSSYAIPDPYMGLASGDPFLGLASGDPFLDLASGDPYPDPFLDLAYGYAVPQQAVTVGLLSSSYGPETPSAATVNEPIAGPSQHAKRQVHIRHLRAQFVLTPTAVYRNGSVPIAARIWRMSLGHAFATISGSTRNHRPARPG